MGRGEERESKGQRGNIFPSTLLLPAFLFSSCEGQAWRGCGLAQWLCTAPCGASHRNPINHWSRSLTPGHKDPTHTAAYTCTCQHTNIMTTCISACAYEGKIEKEKRRQERRWRFLSVFAEVHVIISKMFWQRSAERTEKRMPNSLESHQESSLESV